MDKNITRQQQKSIHKYFQEVADLLNESGISMSVVYENVEADFTKESIKGLFKAFLKAKYGKGSTTQMTTKEAQSVWEEVNRHMAQFGMHIPFPSTEQLINYDENKYK